MLWCCATKCSIFHGAKDRRGCDKSSVPGMVGRFSKESSSEAFPCSQWSGVTKGRGATLVIGFCVTVFNYHVGQSSERLYLQCLTLLLMPGEDFQPPRSTLQIAVMFAFACRSPFLSSPTPRRHGCGAGTQSLNCGIPGRRPFWLESGLPHRI
jgi:hypothetical protein